MILSETEFSKLPPHLQKLFTRLPNPDADEVDAGFPHSVSSKRNAKNSRDRVSGSVYPQARDEYREDNTYGDSGAVSRFFYCAKASRADREEGLDHLPDGILAYSNGAQAALNDGAEEYTGGSTDIGLNNIKKRKNTHPTVKHTELMRYLVKLITPPNGVCLDPFMGSGSTGKACMFEGFQFIGIELDANYVEIAKNRMEFALKKMESVGDKPKKIAPPHAEKADAPPAEKVDAPQMRVPKKRGRPPKNAEQMRLI